VNPYDGPGRSTGGDAGGHDPAEAVAQIRFLEEEVALLRRKLTESPRHARVLEQRLAESASRLAQLSARNEKLTETLKEARSQLVALREEVDRLAQPPSGYGVFLARFPDETVDVFTSGRRMRVAVSPAVDTAMLRSGQTVRLNEALTVVEGGEFERIGEVCALREVLSEPTAELAGRALVVGHADEERIVWLAAPLFDTDDPDLVALKPGDSLLVDTKAGYAYERVPKAEVEDLVLEEVPDVDYSDIGATPSSCRSCTPSCSASTSSARRRACCSTGRPGAARRSSPRRWPTRSPRRWRPCAATTPTRAGRSSSTSRAPSCSTSSSARPSGTSG
jgi:proteasome-associated ATPase